MKSELEKVLSAYENANNSHVWANVKPFVHPSASFFFTDGTFRGLEEVERAVSDTFERIKDERYSILNPEWIIISDSLAICTYNFKWQGLIEGKPRSGSGRGTNVWVKNGDSWQIIHEHLSK